MARARRESTPGDMVRSLLVILVPIVIITVFFTRNVSGPPVREVDWRPVLSQARAEAGFGVLAPSSLPSGWRVTKASWVRQGQPDASGAAVPADTWEFGVLSPDTVYFAVDQRKQATTDYVAKATRNGTPDGNSQVAGVSWNRTVSADQRTRALNRSQGGVGSIVVADTGYAALDTFTATLSTS